MVELSFIENIQYVCRLCLRSEENMQDIIDCETSYKIPLIERIFLFYQVKIAQDDGLPNKICQDCLNFTETFTSYHSSVQKCEAKLQALICTAGALGTKIQHNHKPTQTTSESGCTTAEKPNSNYIEILPDDDCEVVVIDPNQDYESSDESFSEGEYTPPSSRNTPQPVNNENANRTTAPATDTYHHSSNKNTNNSNNINNHNNNSNSNENEVEAGDNELENRNAFLCLYCDMAFVGPSECAEHERHHDRSFPYTCTYCQFRCSDRQVLINHVKESHNEKPFICVVCSKGFGRRSDLKKHAIVHTGIRPFSCSVCGKSFSRNTNLTKHMRIHSGLKPFVCQKCPRSFTTNADLDKHQKIHELNDKPFKCQKCDAGFNRRDKLQNHIKIHLKKEAADALGNRLNQQSDQGNFDGFPSISRPLTVASFAHEANVPSYSNNSLLLKDGTGNFASENLGMSFDQFGGRNSMQNAHAMANPNLNVMGSSFENRQNEFMQQQHHAFQSKMQYSQQQQMLMNNNPLQHSMGQTLGDMQTMQSMGMGNMIMPPPPPVGMNASQQYQMLITGHQQPIKLEPEKPKRAPIHVCSICAKTFTRKRELQRHSVIHSGQKPFACSFCGKRFNRKDKLLRHEKIHLDGKFPCPKCKLDFAKQETLDIHLQLHEKVERASQPQPPQPEKEVQPKVSNFLQSLQVGVTPQLNFYSDTI